jgi:hypothetical protein
MGVEIKFTDRDLPVSPVFIEFLHHRIEGRSIEHAWHDQLSETLVPADFERRVQQAESVAEQVLRHPVGERAIYRAYELFTALMLGKLEPLQAFQRRHRFVCVVGCPRHGGTYLTKHLFRARGFDPAGIPNAIAHDGFPDAAPFLLVSRHNGYTAMMQQTAEYLAMAELFFDGAAPGEAPWVVPKKATKAAYHGAFFASVFGPDTEWVLTLRHPVAACVSTIEKSTGLPADGKFAVRGNIEEWAHRDNIASGADRDALLERPYFEVYLRYWEQYHLNLALGGLVASGRRTVVAYGKERLTRCAMDLAARHGREVEPEAFRLFEREAPPRAWHDAAASALQRVAATWRMVGLDFPLEELMEGC